MSLAKVYIRHQEALPDGMNCFSAWVGFHNRGTEIAPFYGFGDISSLLDLGPDVGLVGYIGDVHEALDLLGEPSPDPLDYPDPLRSYLGREILRTTLKEALTFGQSLFLKPCEPKLFTGFILNGPKDFRRLAGVSEETQVWVSELRHFVSEYRAFILDNEVLDVRRYKGDWSLAPDKAVVEECLATYAQAGGPSAYCLDVGVTNEGKTLLVEVNSAYAFGSYGLQSELYAKMLETSWQSLVPQ